MSFPPKSHSLEFSNKKAYARILLGKNERFNVCMSGNYICIPVMFTWGSVVTTTCIKKTCERNAVNILEYTSSRQLLIQ